MFSFGHVRQLEAVVAKVLTRAWELGAGPGEARLVIDVDSTICEVAGRKKQGAAYGYTRVLGYHPILATRADTGEILHARMRKGSANTSRCARRFVDELVARVRRAGAAGEIVMRFDSGFWSKDTLTVLGRHRVRYTMAVRTNTHAPCSPITSSAGPPTIGAPVEALTVARTVRTRLLAVPGRIVNRSGTLTLRGPARWPWAHLFNRRLTTIRALPAPT